MSCSNCYNGCGETTSDKCVKYTGVDVPLLGIKNGDSLSYVEQALVGFLVSTLDGSGIIIDINPEITVCDALNENLQTCKDLSALDLFMAMIKTICDLDTKISDNSVAISDIEGEYVIGCLPNVDNNSSVRSIIQQLIYTLCTLVDDVTTLSSDINSNYVKIAEVDNYIASYLSSISASTLVSNKMIPYVAVEYYGSIAQFDITGAGTGDWENIYLCNGLNGTPDKRGRVGIGAITGVGGGVLNTAVDPAISGNPAYALNTIGGSNTVSLTESQLPAHTHVATAIVTDPTHTHNSLLKKGENDGGSTGDELRPVTAAGTSVTIATTASSTGISVAVSNTTVGGGLAHSNVQPVLACYYIIYIP